MLVLLVGPGDPLIPPDPDNQVIRPREGTTRTRPLAELGGSAPSFAGGTEGCCVA